MFVFMSHYFSFTFLSFLGGGRGGWVCSGSHFLCQERQPKENAANDICDSMLNKYNGHVEKKKNLIPFFYIDF